MNASTSAPVMASSTPVRRATTWSSSTNPSTTPRSTSSASIGPSSPAMAPPRLPHSTSSPSLPTSSSSPLPQLASPNGSKANSQNYHPYLIQSTSSSLLTRSNSSPSQPIHALGRHRPSRSMSSLAKSAMSEGDLSNSEEREERRRSTESPSAPPRRIVRSSKSGTLPSFLEEKGSPTASRKWVELPLNPKQWTPSELATYLDQTLRHGGPDGTGQRLPGPLVEDIKTWVLRQQVNGRTFLRGIADTWGASSRPPPFLPMLLSLSRRLRRASLQGNPPDVLDSASSVLLETDEEEDETTVVRRMANAIERRDSTSEASDVEEERALRAQLTGGNGGWERWGLKRQNTGGSVGGGTRRRDSIREELGQEQPGLGVLGTSPDEVIVTPLMENGEIAGGQAVATQPEDDSDERQIGAGEGVNEEGDDLGGPGGTLKAPPAGLVGSSSSGLHAAISPSREDTFLHPARLGEDKGDGTPRSERARSEVTPTPERPGPSTSGLGFSPQAENERDATGLVSPRPKPSPAATRYASLRGRGRVLSLRGRAPDDGYDTSDEAQAGNRKVTLRPSHAHIATIFDIDAKSPREKELEQQLAEVLARMKVLETRLEEASRPASPASPAASTVSRGGSITPSTGAMGYVLSKLGLLPADEGLPTRVGELPGYLFLVGVGVGAVMVRVLLGRAR